tara:strand:- start:29 stop:373 length:345 start_codon:yes stop_codon:yes gene_type:complete
MSNEKYKDFLIVFSNLINPVFVEKGIDLAFKRFKKLIKDHVFIIDLIFLKNSLPSPLGNTTLLQIKKYINIENILKIYNEKLVSWKTLTIFLLTKYIMNIEITRVPIFKTSNGM